MSSAAMKSPAWTPSVICPGRASGASCAGAVGAAAGASVATAGIPAMPVGAAKPAWGEPMRTFLASMVISGAACMNWARCAVGWVPGRVVAICTLESGSTATVCGAGTVGAESCGCVSGEVDPSGIWWSVKK
eukprot:13234638-Alexandrium_andersonii.AAC.1